VEEGDAGRRWGKGWAGKEVGRAKGESYGMGEVRTRPGAEAEEGGERERAMAARGMGVWKPEGGNKRGKGRKEARADLAGRGER
jgi:hypothetical protein